MRDNGEKPLKVSKLSVNAVALYPGEKPTFACPVCGVWRSLKRNLLIPHPAKSGKGRCPGTWQRFIIDITPEEWVAQLPQRKLEAVADAAARRGTRVTRKPKVTPAPAVTQMRARSISAPEQRRHLHAREVLASHRAECSNCKAGKPCRINFRLRVLADVAQRTYTTASRVA